MSFSVADAAGALKPGVGAHWRPMRIGSVRVDPELNRMVGPSGEVLLEPKTMEVLVYLASRQNRIVSNDELLEAIWQGRPMGDNPVYRCISQLRKAFGDDPRSPTYIATVPKRGYRLVAPVFSLIEGTPRIVVEGATEQSIAPPRQASRAAGTLAGLGAISLSLVAAIAVGLWMWQGQSKVPVPASGLPTVAVLPFDVAATESEADVTADAAATAILDRLAAYRELRVIARSSSFALKGSGFDAPQIARLLGVQYLLQGSLQLRQDRMLFHVELVDQHGFQVWNRSFEHAMGERFALQNELAADIAERLVGRALPMPDKKREPGFAAYQQWVVGNELMIRRPEGFMAQAKTHFDRAIELDPDFAAPYAERAIHQLLLYGATDDPGMLAMARADVDHALALEPDSGLAHGASGFLKWHQRQADDPLADDLAAEAEFRRALELDPYLVNVWNWLGRILQAQGRYDEGDAALARAARIDPLAATIGVNLARSEAARGRFYEAEVRLQQLSQLPQPAGVVVGTLTDLYISTGRFQPALETVHRMLLHFPTNVAQLNGAVHLAQIHAALGDFEHADAWLARARNTAGSEPGAPDSWRLALATGMIDFPHHAFAESSRQALSLLESTRLDMDDIEPVLQLQLGALLVLGGEFQAGRKTLEPLLERGGIFQFDPLYPAFDARHALCWAWMRTGESERAESQLRMLEDYFNGLSAAGRLHRSEDLLDFARNQLLLGKTDHAMDLLERAERAGWRSYYYLLADPRWESMHGQQRFEAVMLQVKEDVDAQRARIEESMPGQEFIAKLDARMKSRNELPAGQN